MYNFLSEVFGVRVPKWLKNRFLYFLFIYLYYFCQSKVYGTEILNFLKDYEMKFSCRSQNLFKVRVLKLNDAVLAGVLNVGRGVKKEVLTTGHRLPHIEF